MRCVSKTTLLCVLYSMSDIMDRQEVTGLVDENSFTGALAPPNVTATGSRHLPRGTVSILSLNQFGLLQLNTPQWAM